jgi:hypothetical protein
MRTYVDATTAHQTNKQAAVLHFHFRQAGMSDD